MRESRRAAALNRLFQHIREQSGSFEVDLRDDRVVRVEDSANPVDFRIVLIAVQSEAVRRGFGVVDAGSEPIRGELLVGVVVLQHVPHQRDRLLVRVEMPAAEALLAVVVQRADGVVAAVARREVDGHHEVEVQPAFDELEEARLGNALRAADVDRSTVKEEGSGNPREAPPWSGSCRPGLLQKSVVLVWRGEKGRRNYANGALEDVLAVLGELVDGDDDGAALGVRGGEEERNEVVVAEKSDADLEGRPVIVGEDFGAIDLDAAVGFHVIWVKESNE